MGCYRTYPDTTKSIKSKTVTSSEARDRKNGSKCKEEEKLFSPRKLLAEYEEEEHEGKRSGAKKARTKLRYDSATVPDNEQEQIEEESDDEEKATVDAGKDGLFSPALKPPRASRSSSTSPPNAQGRLDIKLRLDCVQPDDRLEDDVALATEVVAAAAADVANEDEQEEEDVTLMEQEFNPYEAAWNELCGQRDMRLPNGLTYACWCGIQVLLYEDIAEV